MRLSSIMKNFTHENSDFLSSDPDLDDLLLDHSMRATFDFCQRWTWNWWEETATLDASRKLVIMKRMEDWFAEREEYEKCQIILDSRRRIEAQKKVVTE